FGSTVCPQPSLPGATTPRSADTRSVDVPATVPVAVFLTVLQRWSLVCHDNSTWTAPVAKTARPPGANPVRPPPPVGLRPGDAPGSQLFFAYRLQYPVLEQRFGQHLLELAVLTLQLFEPSRFVHLHVPKLLLPPVEGHVGDVLLPTNLQNAIALIRLPQ